MSMFENIREDWQTYHRDITRQGFWVMLVYRFGCWRYGLRPRLLRVPFSCLYRVLKLASQILTGIDLPCEAVVGRRFKIEHFGGIIISGDARFGDDCLLRNGVTVGLRRTDQRGAPVFGNRVDIGAGAAILGPVHIGDDVSIGANAVVLTDVPANSIAVGVPAKIKPKRTAARDLSELTLRALVLALFCAWAACAADTFELVKKELKSSPNELIHEFDAPKLESYSIDDGDELSIDVWGRSELSSHQNVGPDGKITLPLLGTFRIAELTREEAQQNIARAYSHYYADPTVTVRVDHYNSYRVYILGRVGSPGPLLFDRQPTLLDVLARAAGLPVNGANADKAGLLRCAVFRGRDKVIWIDLRQLLNKNQLDLNIRLSRNDLVYLPDADDRLVYVLGEVKSPGAYRLTPTLSFLDALSLGGGPTVDAEPQHIALVRTTTGSKQEVSLPDLVSGKTKAVYGLEEGDVIYVPRRGLARVGYLLEKVSPVTAFGVIAAAAVK
jgi:protein involved in polysaccharide export with SLBB domain/serine acetyltransferase